MLHPLNLSFCWCVQFNVLKFSCHSREAFGQGFLRLVDPHGQLLNPLQSLEGSGIQETDAKLKF